METFDWHRMWIGEMSWGFALEIALRSTIMYVYTFGMVRWMSKRMAQQLTPFEFLIVIALGSAVGDPMFYPEVPLLAALLVITVVVALEKTISLVIARSQSTARTLEGIPHTVVEDGRLNFEGMEAEEIALEELLGDLRGEGIEQLGQVKYACIEQSGAISVLRYPNEQVRPGLRIVPPWDVYPPPKYVVPSTVAGGMYVCHRCGQRKQYGDGDSLQPCPICQHEAWSDAVIEVTIHQQDKP